MCVVPSQAQIPRVLDGNEVPGLSPKSLILLLYLEILYCQPKAVVPQASLPKELLAIILICHG